MSLLGVEEATRRRGERTGSPPVDQPPARAFIRIIAAGHDSGPSRSSPYPDPVVWPRAAPYSHQLGKLTRANRRVNYACLPNPDRMTNCMTRKLYAFLVAAVLTAVFSGTPAAAVEPYLEFVAGVRDRGYTDIALEYLDTIEADNGVPADVKLVIPYERGMTLLRAAEKQKNRERQREQFDAALGALEAFVKAAPADHPLAADANTQQGRVWLSRAQVEIWEASAPANEGAEAPFQKRARDYIEKARAIFQQAHDQYEKKVKSYPTFIPEEERELREERRLAEQRFIQAQIDLARCTYQRAQTFDEGSDLRKKTLNEAADEFREIHERYRTYFSGLYARLYQGKCFEEQGDIRKALGLYNEVLEHPGSRTNAALNVLQDRARWFRLICLNHPDRRDFQLVIDEATQWRRDNDARVATETGLGITYELARGYENLADERSTDPKVKDNSLKQTLALARQINRYPGELKGLSASMIQRVMVKLNRDPGDPKDFDTAYGLGNSFLDEVAEKKAEYESAQSTKDKAKIAKAAEAMQAAASEAARMFNIALRLATPLVDKDLIKLARYRLAYSYYLADRPLETAVLGSFIARTYRVDDKQVAQDAAYLALAGLDREFFATPKGQRQYELDLVLEFANQIIEDFPESGRANDAMYAVARLYRADGQQLKAAEWFAKVPSAASQYPAMQIDAGQAYWNVYLTEANKPEGERPAADELKKYRLLAEQHLQRGIDTTERQLGAKAATPDPLALAKISLAQIRNSDGIYTTKDKKRGAIDLLTSEPHSVVKAVAVKDNSKRPTAAGNVKSAGIASLVYQQLLRAYIGVRDLKKARDTRGQLEAVAGKDDAAQLTRVYVEFGRELQKELETLKAAGETERLNGVRSAFEEFLDDLFGRKDGQNYNSLLWIAETYGGLGEGSEDKPAIAKGYFDKAAAAYKSIVDNKGSAGFPDSDEQIAGVKVRLANSQRRQQNFEAAEQTMNEVLQQLPKALDAQFEVARLYEDWGDSLTDNAASEKYLMAITGREEPIDIWGYNRLAQRLRNASLSDRSNEEYRTQHYEANYHVAKVLRKLAESQTGEERDESLDRAKRAITFLTAFSSEFPEDEYPRFNTLYKEILSDQGLPVEDLDTTGGDSAIAVAETDAGATDTTAGDTANAPGAEAAPDEGTQINFALIGLFVLVAAAAVGGLMAMQSAQKKKRKARLEALKSTSPAPRKKKTASKA